MRKTLVIAVAALALVSGCGTGEETTAESAPSATPSTAPSSPVTTEPATPAPTTSTSASPAPTAPEPTASPTPRKLRSGSKGDDVLALQTRLTELGYWNGKADGVFGDSTEQAVLALQKAAGLSRDGVAGPKTRKALTSGVRPKARSSKGTVVEISLKKQVLMLVEDGEVTKIFNTSTGSGEYYESEGSTHLASTPAGKFTVGREIDGWRHAPLGLLWRPKYFNGGIAVHGAYSVPGYPASHGCARVSIAAMNWIWSHDAIPLKTKVWVY
ncbi:peptidoglycan-binding protein [Actinoplanes sp. NPDC051851]|uniref:peptidoglycan-binding protein n=1 Tax=Actinoplanes sp. NPDC051851 TaxID=3154753 RepID=UPI0034248232